MIAHLRGTVTRGVIGEAVIDVAGVGYRVQMPATDWETLREGHVQKIWTHTYVREDRFDLFGFLEPSTLTLFRELIERPGIGPKMALELCTVPRSLLLQAINEQDSALLTNVKGIGKKTAEKLLIELKGLAEKFPDIFFGTSKAEKSAAGYDQDTIAALSQLGYSTPDILRVLPALPKDLHSTEARVTAALRAL